MRIFENFNDQGLGERDAFEKLCCQLFESWGKNEAGFDTRWSFRCINGSGGDGGIEAYWHKADSDEWIGIQAKWFPNRLTNAQFKQIRASVDTALKVRPLMSRYIVCIPHDLTSSKNVKGGKTSRGEDEDWNDFKRAIQQDHPGLVLNLWDESELLKLLNRHENEGCWRFWFNKSEINPTNIRLSLEKITARLSERYTPEITVDGGMGKFLDTFFGTNKARQSFLQELETYVAKTEHIMGEIESFLSLNGQAISQYRESAQACYAALKSYTSALKQLRSVIMNEPSTPLELTASDIDYASIEHFQADIYDLKHQPNFSSHASELDQALDNFREFPSLWELNRTISNAISYTHCTIDGEQGTGKTCGLINKAREYLEEKRHIPILVLATDFNDGESWCQVIKRALGLGDRWDEAALWQALSSYAALGDTSADGLCVRSKVAIMVDGLDENPSPSNWEERIREADIISAKHPRIRFAYTSRPWGIRFNDQALLRCSYSIDDSGDVPVWELFDRYIEHYSVDIDGDDRYKWLLSTPSELQMFCAAYRNRKLPSQVSTCLTNLTNAEIDRLDTEFAHRVDRSSLYSHNELVRKALHNLSALFLNTKKPADESELKNAFSTGDIPEQYHSPLIRLLVQYGILDERRARESSPFAPDVRTYSPGSRHLWDYSMAFSLLHSGDAALKSMLEDNQDIANMYGVLLIEEHAVLPCKSTTVIEALGEVDARETTFYALSHAAPNKTAQFKPWVFGELKREGKTLFDIVNYIIAPVANVAGHPLGPVVLDEYLREFSTPVSRDAVWSLPPSIRKGQAATDKWLSFYYERQHIKQMPKLHGFETASQMPLILTWRLSALSNLERKHCRCELVTWGLQNPSEFAKLFARFCQCDDPQIREDAFAIAEEIVCQGQADDVTKAAIAEEALDSAFARPDAPGNRDAAIRFYARLLVEHCYHNGLFSEEDVKLCRPPYKLNGASNALPIFAGASTATSMSGFGPIHYDLSRYVLVDRLSDAFGISQFSASGPINSSELNSILDDSAKQAGVNPTPKLQGWIIAAAYQYLLDQGYDPEIFEGPVNPEGFRSGGIDRKITRSFFRADHGTRSTVMTVAEKYVWCARNEICGYLADRIQVQSNPWSDSDLHQDGDSLVTDYGMLLDFDSPLFEATATRLRESNRDRAPEFPSAFSCSEDRPCSQSELETWVDAITADCATCLIESTPNTNFAIEGSTIPLALHAHDWGACGKNADAWIYCGAIEPEELSKLENAADAWLDGYSRFLDFYVGLKSSSSVSYISPIEALSAPWTEECDDPYSVEIIADAYVQAKPLSGEGVASLTDIGDYWYYFPSELARELCNSVHTDGARYFDNSGRTVFEEIRYGTEYRHYYRALLADRGALLSAVAKSGLKLIWCATVQRGPNTLAKERIPGIESVNQKSWLIWIDDNGEFQSVAVSDKENTPHQQQDCDDLRSLIDNLTV